MLRNYFGIAEIAAALCAHHPLIDYAIRNHGFPSVIAKGTCYLADEDAYGESLTLRWEYYDLDPQFIDGVPLRNTWNREFMVQVFPTGGCDVYIADGDSLGWDHPLSAYFNCVFEFFDLWQRYKDAALADKARKATFVSASYCPGPEKIAKHLDTTFGELTTKHFREFYE